MSSALGGLYQANAQRKVLKAQSRIATKQAELTRTVGSAQKTKLYADATSTLETAKRNAALEAQEQRQMRRNQEAAAGAAETAAASGGFDVGSGSGRVAREATIAQFDAYIANMAQSSSIGSINAQQRAIDLRREGDMEERMANIDAMNYDGQAAAYRAQAKGVQRGMVKGAIGTVVGGIIGGITGGGSLMAIEKGASAGWNLGASFSPYTASFTSGGGSWNNLFSMFGGGSEGASGGSGGGWTPQGDGSYIGSGGYVGFRRY